MGKGLELVEKGQKRPACREPTVPECEGVLESGKGSPWAVRPRSLLGRPRRASGGEGQRGSQRPTLGNATQSASREGAAAKITGEMGG